MRHADHLTDRQAADAVRSRIDWKDALGVELTDPRFRYPLVSTFRKRLRGGGDEELLLDAMLERFQAYGLRKAGGRALTDSPHVLAAIRTINHLKCVGETLRASLTDLAVVAPDWLRREVLAKWFGRYRPRIKQPRLPQCKAKRYAYAEQIAADGLELLGAILRAMAPRFGNKPSITWTGYKVHLTETCDDNALHVITHVETSEAAVMGVTMTEPINQALSDQEVLSDEPILDAGDVASSNPA